ncbi:MAG: archease [Bauldia sp.]|nr:MAG: archease [Bauldia sp.]MBZ0227105.1 archease [Bauldia sp.]
MKAAPFWEHFSHDADIGIRGCGSTLSEAFEQAALALTAIVTDAPIATTGRVKVTCRRDDVRLLFVDWLDAVIYEMAVRHMLFGRYAVEIDGAELRATLWGEPVDVHRHAPACEPKGATLTALEVDQDAGGLWSARCVVDV